MKSRKLTAVVLAAGRGKRLRPFTTSMPKCLVPIGGEAILGRMLDLLQRAGIRSIVIVTGYRAAQIHKFIRARWPRLSFRIMRNPIHDRTNTLYSLWVSRKVIAGKPFLLLDGDLVFEPKILTALLRTKNDSVLACDGSRKVDDEAVCAWGASNSRILRIGKRISVQGSAFGESIGMARINSQASRRLFRVAGTFLRNGGARFYYEAAFQRLMDEGIPFWAVDIDGARWTEIDTKSDLRRARAFFKQSAKRAR